MKMLFNMLPFPASQTYPLRRASLAGFVFSISVSIRAANMIENSVHQSLRTLHCTRARSHGWWAKNGVSSLLYEYRSIYSCYVKEVILNRMDASHRPCASAASLRKDILYSHCIGIYIRVYIYALGTYSYLEIKSAWTNKKCGNANFKLDL